MKYTHLYKEIEAEIERSEKKHGNQDHIPSLDQTLLYRKGGCSIERMLKEYELPTAERAQYLCDKAMEHGEHTHAHIVVEELCEAIACLNNTVEMRKELIQLACVVVKWIKALDHQTEPKKQIETGITTDPSDPTLSKGLDDKPVPQLPTNENDKK